jgi:hypothetical protein
LELLNLDLERHFNGYTGTLQPTVVNYLHTAGHSPRDLESGCAVSSPSRDECSAFGPSASNDTFDVYFSVPHQRTLVSQDERPDYTARAAQSHALIQYYAAAATCTSSIFTSSHSNDKRAV